MPVGFILGQQPVTIRRQAAGGWSDAGLRVPGSVTEFTAKVSFQHATGSVSQLLPEGTRVSNARVAFCATELKTVDLDGDVGADRIVYLGSEWMVQVRMYFDDETTPLGHNEYLIIRKQADE